MDKQAREDTTWVPQTPIKPIAPIYPDHQIQTEEERLLVGNKDKSGVDHLSFVDLLALANTASSVFLSRQTGIDKEHVIKTPEKPKRKKHRPKVVREVKPKRVPKPRTPKKPAAAAVEEGQESKTPKRKYVRKKKEEADEDQEYTPLEESAAAAGEASAHGKKACRRTLDFEGDSLEPEKDEIQHRDETGEKQDQELQDCHMAVPSTPKRKRSSQPRRMGKEPVKNNEAQATKRRQGKKPNSNIYFSGSQYDEVFEYYNEEQLLYLNDSPQKGTRSQANPNTSFAGQQQLVVQDCYSFASQGSSSRVLTFQGRQSFESMDKIGTPTKKRTTGHARFRGLSSINKSTQMSEQSQAGRYSSRQQVIAKKPVASSRKKRTSKSQKSQTKQLALLPNHCQFPPLFAAGLSPDEIWRQRYSVEAISELMRLLDINREYSETALVPYGTNSSYSIGNEIVIFNGGPGAIVPSTRVKKPRRERAKVNIDNETDRVWKLLMDNIDSEGVDGSDEKKAKWWEEERNVFRGRADSFIARMHLVQGDRRFTPWKGSVVDSVVGVFLTQNVSDHLSSSAFMSLAAAYPAPVIPSSDFEVGTSSMPSIRITYLDSDEPVSNPPVHNEVSATLNITQPDEEKDYVNSNDTSRSSSEIASSGNESAAKTMDPKARVDLDRTGSSVEVMKTDQMYLVQELLPSEDSVLTCQKSLVSETPQSTERTGSSSEINSEAEHYTSYVKLLESQGSAQLQEKERDVITADTVLVEEANQKTQCSSSPGSLQVSSNTSPGDCSSEVKDIKSLKGKAKCTDDDEPCCFFGDVLSVHKPDIPESSSSVPSAKLVIETRIPDINESTNCLDVQEGTEKQSGHDSSSKEINPMDKAAFNANGKKILKEVAEEFDWDSLRREAQDREGKREKTARTLDSVDWEAIRTADVNEVAETIKSRGMNHKLAERIQGFLNRLLTDHGSLDLEWLRDVPPDKAKEYLLSFNGLGLKSVECVRLLTLHHLAFPVDTNVGRIAVRLGWVPLQPLPESLQLHLLEMYPVLESIQKYLWPRLCKFDQKTLYELHYQMITFGKVFCTKSKPNCNACPMRGECRHFASAFASARLSLPGPEKGMETPDLSLRSLPEPLRRQQGLEVVNHSEAANRVTSCEPIIEEPASPEPQCGFWRHVLGTKDAVDGVDIALGKYVITLSSEGSVLRAWNLPDGQMVWETSLHSAHHSKSLLSVPINLKVDKDYPILVFGGGYLHAVSPLDGEVLWKKDFTSEGFEVQRVLQPLESTIIYVLGFLHSSDAVVYQIDSRSGEVVAEKTTAFPGGFSGEISSVSNDRVVVLDSTRSILVTISFVDGGDVSFQKTRISDLVEESGEAEILPPRFSDMLAVKVNKRTIFVRVGGEGKLEVVDSLSDETAMSDSLPVADDQVAFASVHHEGSKIHLAVKLVDDLETVLLRESIQMDQHRGRVDKVFINNYIKTDRSNGFRALIVMEDHSLLLLQQGAIVWSREEGLASVTDVTTAELPVEKDGVSVAKVEHTLVDWLKGHILKLKGSLLLASPEDVVAIQEMRMKSSGRSKLTRDHNGFRKLFIALTRAGKLFALHTGDGRIVWSVLLNSPACARPSGVSLYQWQVPHHHAMDENPSVLVVGRCGSDSSSPGVLSFVDVYTGKEISSSDIGHSVVQVMPLPFTDSTEQRLHLIADTDGHVHLYPKTSEALTIFQREFQNVYWYNVEADNGIIRGHGMKSSCAGETADEYCFTTRELWTVVFPSESEKIISTLTRKPNEVVHTQAKVSTDQDVLYKYVSRNLLFVATVSPKGAGEIGSVTPEESALVVYLIDTITGRILHRLSHQGCQGPVHAVFSENWVVYHYFNLRAHKYEVTVVEIYDQSRAENKNVWKLVLGKHNLTAPISSYSRPEMFTKSQSYFFPQSVKTIAVTSTAKGITSKQLLIGTIGDQILALDKRFVDPRRTLNPSQAEKEEGIIPLTDSLPIIPQSYITHSLKVEGLRGIVTAPAKLESTTHVFAYGVDLFYTRLAPSKTYDSLTDDFSYALLLITIVALVAAIYITWAISEKKELSEKWR